MKKLMIGVVVALLIGAGAVLSFKMMKDKDDGTNSPASSNSTSTSSNTEAAKVDIKDFSFGPAKLEVKKGTTVTWTNADSVSHTVTSDSGDGPNSELIEQGDSFSFTFDKAGTFKYHCTPHPQMTGEIVVK